jgi:hypothetical protein
MALSDRRLRQRQPYMQADEAWVCLTEKGPGSEEQANNARALDQG